MSLFSARRTPVPGPLALVAATLLLTAAGAAAQPQGDNVHPSITVSAEATVTAAPDQAQIDIGVTTQSATAAEAAQLNAAKLDRVMAELRRVAGEAAAIRTLGYTVRPDYGRPEPGGAEMKISGYTASNVLRVTLDDLAKVGDLIDAATRSGANEIRRLQFGLKDPQAAQAEALKQAAARARAQADALASALNVHIVRILNAVESGGPVQPMREMMLASRADVSTPIEPGTVDVSANVTLTLEISEAAR